VANLLLAPFLLVFLLIYFFMRNAEKFYHQPSSAGARRWSSLAAWRLREFNELPHYLNHRWPTARSEAFLIRRCGNTCSHMDRPLHGGNMGPPRPLDQPHIAPS
jgi:hypothetical protein